MGKIARKARIRRAVSVGVRLRRIAAAGEEGKLSTISGEDPRGDEDEITRALWTARPLAGVDEWSDTSIGESYTMRSESDATDCRWRKSSRLSPLGTDGLLITS